MNPHIVFGVVGILAILVGTFSTAFPDAARRIALKPAFLLPRNTAELLYTRALMLTIGIGQIVVGTIFIIQWIVSATV